MIQTIIMNYQQYYYLKSKEIKRFINNGDTEAEIQRIK